VEIEPLAVPLGRAALTLLPRLAAALEGGCPVLPYAATAPPPLMPPYLRSGLPEGLAVVVGTSGSTGTPKRALLTASALTASARGTHERLGGPGRWLLALPAHHVAGLQVLLRSLDAGTAPVAMDLADGFSPREFAAATRLLDPGGRRYTALVPTQLVRLLGDPAGAEALRRYDAVLVGGAALPPSLRRAASAEGATVVATYGMSETAGGCVYDGRALRGTTVRLDDEGRVHLGGDTLAEGYLSRPDLDHRAFHADADGGRWFRTDDVGHVDADGRLHVDGRVDDLVITGGMKVAPRLVEEAVAAHVPGVREVVVVGTPDREWGQAVSALVVPAPGTPEDALTLTRVRAHLRGIVPDHALPHRVLVAAEVPLAGPGKPDRRAVAALFDVG
jgi:O-succinylbenzoic acid--CoA ligase